MGRNTRYLIIIPAVLFALFAKPAKAEVLYGIETTYYQIDQIPPAQSTDTYPVCGSEIENNINRSYDGEPYLDCTYDLFMVHMTGYLNIPEHDTIEFWLASDDGGTINIGGNTFGTWQDQGCSATMSGPLQLEPGAIPFEVFMYENGGGTCLMLAWKIDDNYWEMVPEWAFTTTSTPSTTTTTTTFTVPETTVPVTNPTTTTVQETTTTTTSVENSTSTSSVPQTTTTESTTTTTQPPPPPTFTPPQTVPPVSVETSAPTTLPETTTSTTSTTVTATTTTSPPPSSTTTTTSTSSIPPATTIAPESPQTTLPAVLSDLTPTQALSVALATETLTTLTASQAEQVFASIETSELSDTQVAEITEAVQDAPTEVREAFEEEVDVFKAGFDDYVPLGSNIPVSERRTLIAVTAGITLAVAGTRIRR
jgi:hypothetical protein